MEIKNYFSDNVQQTITHVWGDEDPRTQVRPVCAVESEEFLLAVLSPLAIVSCTSSTPSRSPKSR